MFMTYKITPPKVMQDVRSIYIRNDYFDSSFKDRYFTTLEERTCWELSIGEIAGNLDENTDFIHTLAIHRINGSLEMHKCKRLLYMCQSMYV